MLSELSCNEHQALRYSAKSIHAVNEGSATEVDRYQMSKMGISIALEMLRSPRLARPPYRTAEEAWLPDGCACRVAQGRNRPGKMTQSNLLNTLCLWGHGKDSQISFLEISLSVQTTLHEGCQVQFWELLGAPATRKCGYGVRDPSSADWNGGSSTVIKLRRTPVFSLEHPSSREHTVF